MRMTQSERDEIVENIENEALRSQILAHYEKMLDSVSEVGLRKTLLTLEQYELFYGADGHVSEEQKAYTQAVGGVLRHVYLTHRDVDGSILAD